VAPDKGKQTHVVLDDDEVSSDEDEPLQKRLRQLSGVGPVVLDEAAATEKEDVGKRAAEEATARQATEEDVVKRAAEEAMAMRVAEERDAEEAVVKKATEERATTKAATAEAVGAAGGSPSPG
jgi:hypothetical protein